MNTEIVYSLTTLKAIVIAIELSGEEQSNGKLHQIFQLVNGEVNHLNSHGSVLMLFLGKLPME